jgi:hypothetical protein
LPPKANGRPGFHESAILLLRQGVISGTTLAAIPCLFLSVLPCIISGKTLENSREGGKECIILSQDSFPVKSFSGALNIMWSVSFTNFIPTGFPNPLISNRKTFIYASTQYPRTNLACKEMLQNSRNCISLNSLEII